MWHLLTQTSVLLHRTNRLFITFTDWALLRESRMRWSVLVSVLLLLTRSSCRFPFLLFCQMVHFGIGLEFITPEEIRGWFYPFSHLTCPFEMPWNSCFIKMFSASQGEPGMYPQEMEKNRDWAIKTNTGQKLWSKCPILLTQRNGFPRFLPWWSLVFWVPLIPDTLIWSFVLFLLSTNVHP